MWVIRAVLCTAALAGSSASVAIRRIDKVSPSRGSTQGGTRITITGVGFSTDYADGENRVEIDGRRCPTIEDQGRGVCMVRRRDDVFSLFSALSHAMAIV